MSHRTIIELNHDCVHQYMDRPELLQNLLQKMISNDWKERFTQETPGIRKVAERHHSESVEITIGRGSGSERAVKFG